jgi:drug/metabolite transporter superfamily protein YnfA
MDRLKVSLAATSAVFFWLPVALILMVAGLFGSINYSFGLVFVMLGIPSSVGCVLLLSWLKRTIRLWYLALPLVVTLLAGTACALYATAMPGPAFPAEGAGLFVMNAGIAVLMLLAPCALLLFIALLQRREEPVLIKGGIGVSAVVSLFSFAMLFDMVFVALHLYRKAIFSHPLGEGFLILYGMAGTPAIGVILILAGFRFTDKCQPGPDQKQR